MPTIVSNIMSLPEWKKPGRLILAPGQVYVGRRNPRIAWEGVDFGNPFSHQKGAAGTTFVRDRATAVMYHRRWLEGDPEVGGMLHPSFRNLRKAVLAEVPALKDKVLFCWCAPDLCHGHFLAFLADNPLRRPAP